MNRGKNRTVTQIAQDMKEHETFWNAQYSAVRDAWLSPLVDKVTRIIEEKTLGFDPRNHFGSKA